jgi:hypothetical protein
MPKKVNKFTRTQQPINWGRAFVSGMVSAALMMGFIDTFNMMGITPFSFERYIGTLVTLNSYFVHTWTIGFFLNLILGGLFGIVYGYCFEYVFSGANGRFGIKIGFWHTILAAVAFFPFFGAIHETMGTGLFPNFGILGWKLGIPTPLLLIAGHLLFGLCMGTFYGPVRADRVRTKVFEPGETEPLQKVG